MADSRTRSLRNRSARFFRRGSFTSSADYWENRYLAGEHSGNGSYGRLAEYKADFLNGLIARTETSTVLELGCGEGAQLALATYSNYVGVDIVEQAVELCRQKFKTRPEWSFTHTSDPKYRTHTYDLTMSLDVIYHLVEDEVFAAYMNELFGLANDTVVIFSSNEDATTNFAHVRHRRFTDWIDANQSAWSLTEHAPNPYPLDPTDPSDTTFAEFFVFTKNVRPRRRG